jgi:hypothetical protein
LKKKLKACRRRGISRNSVAREEILKNKVEKLEDKKEFYWRQQVKVPWLKQGDKNTRFFHEHASERRRLK